MAVARLLIERGADINAADFWGRTPIFSAVEIRNRDITRGNEFGIDRDAALEIVTLLLDRGANPNPRTREIPPIRRWVTSLGDLTWINMYDLEVLAFRAEITRVATMMYARDTSLSVYPQSGVRESFHVASHHSNARAQMDRFAIINRYHVSMLAYFLEKLQSTPDGDGTLLDHSIVLYGSSMSNGNQHDHDPLPVILAGGASGQLDGGRHVQSAPHTPMSNLLLSIVNKLGIDQAQHGDSTGLLDV